jgi:hypothetical protein
LMPLGCSIVFVPFCRRGVGDRRALPSGAGQQEACCSILRTSLARSTSRHFVSVRVMESVRVTTRKLPLRARVTPGFGARSSIVCGSRRRVGCRCQIWLPAASFLSLFRCVDCSWYNIIMSRRHLINRLLPLF